MISFVSCNSQTEKKITKYQTLSEINKIVKQGKANYQVYQSMDSFKNIIDGADAELYLEVYKNAILYDTEHFKDYLLKNKLELDRDVLDFFSQSDKKKDSINIAINKIYPDYMFVSDSDGFVYMRIEPNSQSQIITKVKTNEKVNIVDSIGDWKKVLYNCQTGYVYKNRLSKNKEKFIKIEVLDDKTFLSWKGNYTIGFSEKREVSSNISWEYSLIIDKNNSCTFEGTGFQFYTKYLCTMRALENTLFVYANKHLDGYNTYDEGNLIMKINKIDNDYYMDSDKLIPDSEIEEKPSKYGYILTKE